MTERSVTHATFVIERTYAASPARVFNAFADPAAKKRWFTGPDEVPGGATYSFEALIQDIVPNERIVTTYNMHMDEAQISVSVSTTELKPDGSGTRLVYTEQGAFLDGYDNPAEREHGTRELLEALDKYLKGNA